MHQYEVDTIMGKFFVVADYYSLSPDGTRVLFWVNKKIKVSFLLEELKHGFDSIAIQFPE